MPTALALRHVAFEDLGILEALLRARDFRIDYHDIGTTPLPGEQVAGCDLLVVLGGPIGIGDRTAYPCIDEVTAALHPRLQMERPTLGICLGAQLMAHALGAEVAPMGDKEIGFSPLTLTDAGRGSPLRKLDPDVPVLHWHGDAFDIPAEAELLASSRRCRHQAFSVGNHALALQFHIEADLQRIEQWLIGHAAELAASGIDPATLRAEAVANADRVHAAGRAVFEDWLEQVGFAAAR